MRDFVRTYYQTSFSVKVCEIKKYLPNNFNIIFKALNLNFKSKVTYTSKKSWATEKEKHSPLTNL
jgi:hypothetical protein